MGKAIASLMAMGTATLVGFLSWKGVWFFGKLGITSGIRRLIGVQGDWTCINGHDGQDRKAQHCTQCGERRPTPV